MKKILESYKQKRNLKISREPKAKLGGVKKDKPLIFVIQEHHASHLHFDFRLELDGVLKSWAIPKGPPTKVHEKRLAIEVEDHPLEYAHFQGIIPEGQYGAGEVLIWDTGTWQASGDPHSGLKKGKLEFTLSGEKLNGDFVLLRFPAKKNNWLLMKKKSQWPGFIEPQLARLDTKPPSGSHYLHEIKFDGYRLQIHIQNNQIKLFTRSGIDWSAKFPTIINALKKIKVESAIFDSEAIVQDKWGRSHFELLQEALSKKDDSSVKFFLFDCLFLNGNDLRVFPLVERKKQLSKLLPLNQKVLHYTEDIKEKSDAFFKIICKEGLEGIVSKDKNAPYISGRNSSWYKVKCTKRQELVIGGYTDTRGGRGIEIGALLLGVFEKNKFRYVGKVGSGFNRQGLVEIKEKVKQFEQTSSPFDGGEPKGKNIHWLRPKLVAEVDFTSWTKTHHLRHPVFIGFREDKKATQVVREETRFTHPEKLVFKGEKITKNDVAKYYNEVLDLFFKYAKDRPLSLVRCPNGINKKCFYQKHFENKKDYISLKKKETLKEFIQLNVIEVHLQNCSVDLPSRPNQIVIDFDPGPGIEFKQIIFAALLLKKILDGLKLKSFVKTTGGKGLHVHIPFEPLYNWNEVTAFSRDLARLLVEKDPTLFTAEIKKDKRIKKIFVDYLRNMKGATAIAPYSLRSKENSSVAMPVAWNELSKLKSSEQFSLESALLKIKKRKSDPWKNYFSIKQKIKVLDRFQEKSKL